MAVFMPRKWTMHRLRPWGAMTSVIGGDSMRISCTTSRRQPEPSFLLLNMNSKRSKSNRSWHRGKPRRRQKIINSTMSTSYNITLMICEARFSTTLNTWTNTFQQTYRAETKLVSVKFTEIQQHIELFKQVRSKEWIQLLPLKKI